MFLSLELHMKKNMISVVKTVNYISQGECTVTESPIFFKLCEITVSLCSKIMTKAYDPLFTNTRENHVNTREDIFSFSYYLFCAVLQGMMWPSCYGRCIFSGDISGSDLAVWFFVVNFVHVFKYHFCSPLLVPDFLYIINFFVTVFRDMLHYAWHASKPLNEHTVFLNLSEVFSFHTDCKVQFWQYCIH